MAKLYDYVLKNPKITSGYGKRTHPITGEKNKMHYGTDLHASSTNIYAIEDGYVQKVVTGQDKATTGYGNYIWVRYPRINLSLFHAHCSKVLLKKGDKVQKGTVVAIMGRTGAATGVHLHLGVTKIGSDTWLNPQSIDYTPVETPKVETDTKEIETLNNKINELNKQIETLNGIISTLTKDNEIKNTQIWELEGALVDERKRKFVVDIKEDGTYSIDLLNGETLIVK